MARILLSLLILSVSIASFAQETPSQRARKTLATLSLEKKVAQLVCTQIDGSLVSDPNTGRNPKLEEWLALVDKGIGGFVVYGGTPRNAAQLLNQLQKASGIPILISTDFEGGAGQQFFGASEFPSNMAFAAIGDEALMYRAAKVMASEGKAIGIHLSYTPVSDISISPDNPQESGRSFGGNFELIQNMLNAYVKGYHEAGMLTTSKHFPGRGDMKGGPAYPSFTTLDKSPVELNANEFRAFTCAINAGVDFMMTEHIAIPAVTGGSMLPASVEPKLVKGIIRDQLGFKGIITSDDLWYDHVIARFGKEEVAVMALAAGHDIVLKPKDPIAAIDAIVDAVNKSRIPLAQIDSSVFRLLKKKYELDLDRRKIVDVDNVNRVVGTKANKALVQEVADRSLTLLKNEKVFPLKKFDPARTVHITIQKTDDQPNVNTLIREMTDAFPGMKHFSVKPSSTSSNNDEIVRASMAADHVIISFLVQRDRHGDPAPLTDEVIAMIDKISNAKPGKVIAMSYGNPHLIRKVKNIPSFIVGYGEGGFYGNQTVYFNSVIRLLKGAIKPTAKLPVKISDDMPIGFGLSY
jgi:beta-N-acetylhexosaminidase